MLCQLAGCACNSPKVNGMNAQSRKCVSDSGRVSPCDIREINTDNRKRLTSEGTHVGLGSVTACPQERVCFLLRHLMPYSPLSSLIALGAVRRSVCIEEYTNCFIRVSKTYL